MLTVQHFTHVIIFGENTADVFDVDTNTYLCSFATGKSASLMTQCDYETIAIRK